jgi:hypothetical protein
MRRSTRTWLAATIAPAAAGIAAMAFGATPASAADVETSRHFTYVNFDGQEITCGMVSSQSYDPDRQVAHASTFVGDGGECERTAFVVIDATYVTTGRKPMSGSAAGYGEALGSWEPVVDELRTRHRIYFEYCDWDASPEGCELEFTLVQPK